MTDEDRQDALKRVTLADAKKVLYRLLRRVQCRKFVVIGDFDPAGSAEAGDAAIRRLEEFSAVYKVITRDWQKLAPVERSTENPDKADSNFTMISTMAMNQDDPDYWPMVLADQILGGGEKSRLWTRIRLRRGGLEL